MHLMGNQSKNYRIDYDAKRPLQERKEDSFTALKIFALKTSLINNFKLLINSVNMRFN